MNYQEYLQSDNWQKKRDDVFSAFGRMCFFCGSTEKIQVHHKRYEIGGKSVIGEERIGKDLIPLCDQCHGLWHKYHNNKKMNRLNQKKQKQLLSMGASLESSIELCDKNVSSRHFQTRLYYYYNRPRDMRVVAH